MCPASCVSDRPAISCVFTFRAGTCTSSIRRAVGVSVEVAARARCTAEPFGRSSSRLSDSAHDSPGPLQSRVAALASVITHIESPGELAIDLAGVSKSNSAGPALMIEWLARAGKAGHAIQYRNVPESLMELARVSQVDELIAAGSRDGRSAPVSGVMSSYQVEMHESIQTIPQCVSLAQVRDRLRAEEHRDDIDQQPFSPGASAGQTEPQ
ncbi:MAG: hypothetical protein CSB44_03125 [Gammaproteobacteria bacterium]|nr:MAG: hypothetical protein CSB44_03125 [Gammaproteobacteria bacterium]